MKKIFSILLTLIVTVLACSTLTACGESKLSYVEQEDGTLFVSALLENTDKVVIPATYDGKEVTGIEEDAFSSNATIKEVVLPDSVTYIGGSAFKNCSNLAKVNLNKVEVVDKSAFEGTKLNTVTLSNVMTIENNAFKNCKSLKKVTLSNNILELGKSAFSGCIVMTDCDLGSVQKVGESCFSGCGNLVNVNLSKVKYFQKASFMSCASLNNIVLTNVIEVEHEVFNTCTSLSHITVGVNAKVLHLTAFEACPLQSVILLDPLNWVEWLISTSDNKHYGVYDFDNMEIDLSDPVVAKTRLTPNSWGGTHYFLKKGYDWHK